MFLISFSSLTSTVFTSYNKYISHVTDGSGFTTWSMTVDADRLGESTGQAGFCFYADAVLTGLACIL